MCENCKDEILIEETQQIENNQENQITYQPFLEMELDNLMGIQYDSEEFERGVRAYSFQAGAITSLINSGLDASQALEIIINDSTIKHNLEVQKMTCINNLEMAKIQEMKLVSNTI